MADFGTPPPTSTLPITPFIVRVAQEKIDDFKESLKRSPLAVHTYENSSPLIVASRRYGVPHSWLANAKASWLDSFDWRATETQINSFPNYTAQVADDLGHNHTIHFVALFSSREDAIPLVLYHGWPGSFLEFFPILRLLQAKHTPEALPYHVVVPSLPGYAFSSGPPLDVDFSLENAAEALNNLAAGLFPQGYLAQGGDLGSMIARYQATHCSACKGVHLNCNPVEPPAGWETLPTNHIESEALSRGEWFMNQASAYSHEHGTRTATIGHVLSSSPLALLAWIGEKFLEWSDEDPELEVILASVSLYWYTDTLARCLYPYRGLGGGDERPRIWDLSDRGHESPFIAKPCGYSFFPKEVLPMPVSWVAKTANLVSSSVHSSGGHFAAMEKPEDLLHDLEDYALKAWVV